MFEPISRNTDITYVDSVEIDGKMKPAGMNLPQSFSPMFTGEMPTPCGTLTGKHMEERDGEQTRFIDLTTMEYTKTHPEPPAAPKTWSGWYCGSYGTDDRRRARMPMSGMNIINDCGHVFDLLQETERWILIHTKDDYEDPETHEIRVRHTKFLLDKRKCEEFLHFNTEAGNYARRFDDAHHTFVHLLPGSVGAIVFHDNQEALQVYYDDIGSMGQVGLAYLNFNADELVERFRPIDTRHGKCNKGSQRKLVVTYAGMLYLHLRESILVPLWIDLEDESDDSFVFEGLQSSKVAVGGLRADMKTLLLAPKREFLSRHQQYGIVCSADGRWAMQTLSCGRIVVDLATQKSYIIRPQAKWPNPGFVFVGRDSDKPVFYRCHMAYGIKMTEDEWEDLDETVGCISNIKDTGSYLKYRDPNEIAAEDHRRMIPLRSTVVQPNIRDQDEKSVPLVL
ncbi:hypothetical protein CJU89_5153 [Yarrowia sp. B02]|nr:hypothetical protein CJU89_5153 [Yarrowia sp. B02]